VAVIRIVRDGAIAERSDDLAAAWAALTEPSTIVWFGVTPDELRLLTEHLDLHAHGLEDATKPREHQEFGQRTKLDRYPGQVFLHLYLTSLADDGELQLRDVSVFASPRFIVVVRDEGAYDPDEIAARWSEHPEMPHHGTMGLLHALLDLVVDSHLETVDAISDRVDAMEDLLFDGPQDVDANPRELQRGSYETRKALVRLRRVAQPMREIVGGIMRSEPEDTTPVDAVIQPYYQDLYDHALRVNDSIEGLRDLLTTMYETRLAMADHTLNNVMKKLTGWAAIIAVITAVTGFYGQNVPYPGFLRPWGFWTSTLVWVGMSVGLFVFLRRRRWI
jgi:magnesium transporter